MPVSTLFGAVFHLGAGSWSIWRSWQILRVIGRHLSCLVGGIRIMIKIRNFIVSCCERWMWVLPLMFFSWKEEDGRLLRSVLKAGAIEGTSLWIQGVWSNSWEKRGFFSFIFNALGKSVVDGTCLGAWVSHLCVWRSFWRSIDVHCGLQRQMWAWWLPSRKGMSSVRVLSGPKARAIVLSLLMALSLRATSSCLSSSMRTVIGCRSCWTLSICVFWGESISMVACTQK